MLQGASHSGEDLALEISQNVQDLYLVAKIHPNLEEGETFGPKNNINKVEGIITKIDGNKVHIKNDEETQILEDIDSIVFCTGYKYNFEMIKDLPEF